MGFSGRLIRFLIVYKKKGVTAMIFTISIGIGACFDYSRWYLKKDITRVKFGTRIQTTIS